MTFFFAPIHPAAFLKIIQAGTPSITSSVYVVFRLTQFLLAFIIQRGLGFLLETSLQKKSSGIMARVEIFIPMKGFYCMSSQNSLPWGPRQGRSFLLSNSPYDHQVSIQIRFTNQQKKNSEQPQEVQPQLKNNKTQTFLKHLFLCFSPPSLPRCLSPWHANGRLRHMWAATAAAACRRGTCHGEAKPVGLEQRGRCEVSGPGVWCP